MNEMDQYEIYNEIDECLNPYQKYLFFSTYFCKVIRLDCGLFIKPHTLTVIQGEKGKFSELI